MEQSQTLLPSPAWLPLRWKLWKQEAGSRGGGGEPSQHISDSSMVFLVFLVTRPIILQHKPREQAAAGLKASRRAQAAPLHTHIREAVAVAIALLTAGQQLF